MESGSDSWRKTNAIVSIGRGTPGRYFEPAIGGLAGRLILILI